MKKEGKQGKSGQWACHREGFNPVAIYYPLQGDHGWIASLYGSVLMNTAQMYTQGKSRTFGSQ